MAAQAAAADAELAAAEAAVSAAAESSGKAGAVVPSLLYHPPPRPPLPVCTSIELREETGKEDRAQERVVYPSLSPAAFASVKKKDPDLSNCTWLLHLSFFEFAIVLRPRDQNAASGVDVGVEGHIDPLVVHLDRVTFGQLASPRAFSMPRSAVPEH